MSIVDVFYGRLFETILLLAVAFFSGCTSERSYDVRGRVAGFADDGRTLIVEHENIPGLMPAMTMPFDVRDSTAISDLAIGDAVAFELVVESDRSWITSVVRLSDDAVSVHPAGQPDTFLTGAPRLLDRGDRLPDADLLTHADTTLRLSDLRGRRVLVSFIYTRCPIPDFCPRMSRQFAQLQPTLDTLAGPPVHLLSISFDPTNDTPEVLRSYADRHTDDLSNWTFATGDTTTVRRLADQFGIFYKTDADQILHNLVTVLVDSSGKVLQIWRGTDWRPVDVRTALERSDGAA